MLDAFTLPGDERAASGFARTPVSGPSSASPGQFDLQTVAEGIEDEPTWDYLRALGVDFGQGYYLGRPAPIPAAEQ